MASSIAAPTPTINVSPPRPQALRARVSFTSMASDYDTTAPNLGKVPQSRASSGDGRKSGRNRSSSLLSVHEIRDNYDDQLDQGVGPNLNAEWVHYKGAWTIHLILIVFGKILVDIVPGITQDLSWTVVNLSYDLLTYLMFHYVTGTPFESSGGVYDRLTLWEQIDMGAHYTPAKKYYTVLPIGLFLVCTHYTHFAHYPSLFALNFLSTFCLALLPKLPVFHRLRFRFFEGIVGTTAIGDERSGPPTPIEESMRKVGDRTVESGRPRNGSLVKSPGSPRQES